MAWSNVGALSTGSELSVVKHVLPGTYNFPLSVHVGAVAGFTVPVTVVIYRSTSMADNEVGFSATLRNANGFFGGDYLSLGTTDDRGTITNNTSLVGTSSTYQPRLSFPSARLDSTSSYNIPLTGFKIYVNILMEGSVEYIGVFTMGSLTISNATSQFGISGTQCMGISYNTSGESYEPASNHANETLPHKALVIFRRYSMGSTIYGTTVPVVAV